MRTFAIIANLILLAIIGLMVARGQIELEPEYMLLFLFMIVAPIVSIIALLLRGVGSKDWLSRYFERKAMEERGKLERLRVPSGQPVAALNGGSARTLVDSGVVPRPPAGS